MKQLIILLLFIPLVSCGLKDSKADPKLDAQTVEEFLNLANDINDDIQQIIGYNISRIFETTSIPLALFEREPEPEPEIEIEIDYDYLIKLNWKFIESCQKIQKILAKYDKTYNDIFAEEFENFISIDASLFLKKIDFEIESRKDWAKSLEKSLKYAKSDAKMYNFLIEKESIDGYVEDKKTVIRLMEILEKYLGSKTEYELFLNELIGLNEYYRDEFGEYDDAKRIISEIKTEI